MELKCEFRYVARDGVQFYTCFVEEASITKPFNKIKDYEPEKSNEDVEEIQKQLSITSRDVSTRSSLLSRR
jgi:hypothetical protein